MTESPSLTTIAQALLIVVASIFVLRVVLRSMGLERFRGKARSLRVVESCALDAKGRLYLVDIDGERMLLGSTDQQVSVLRGHLPRVGPAAAVGEERPPEGEKSGGLALPPLLRRFFPPLLVLVISTLAPPAGAQALAELGAGLPELVEQSTKPERISGTLEILALLTFMSIAPSILLMATCFTRVVIVLSLLRQALGVAQLPPNQVIVGLALAITVFAMAPVGAEIESEALAPYVAEEIEASVAVERAGATVRTFMLRHTRERDLSLFVSYAGEPPETREDVSFSSLLPSYMLSEIRTAFEIGFTLFLPFLVVDLVIASMLISMQMIVLPPIVISLPFKLMLFVLLDGWNLIAGSLISGIR